jgi:hypothetical protein
MFVLRAEVEKGWATDGAPQRPTQTLHVACVVARR